MPGKSNVIATLVRRCSLAAFLWASASSSTHSCPTHASTTHRERRGRQQCQWHCVTATVLFFYCDLHCNLREHVLRGRNVTSTLEVRILACHNRSQLASHSRQPHHNCDPIVCTTCSRHARTTPSAMARWSRTRARDADRNDRKQLLGNHDAQSQAESDASRQAGTSRDPKIAAVQQQLADVRGLALNNIDKALARGARLDELEVRTRELNATSSAFRGMAKRTKRRMFWRAVKHYAVIAAVAVGVVAVVVLAIAL